MVPRLTSTTIGPLPTFLVLGAQKSATRWLRSHLGEHPQIFVSDAEIAYFNNDRRHALGLDWYRSQFRAAGDEPIVGESTPGYLMWHHDPSQVASRIAAALPRVQLIAVLRDPVARACSAFLHHRRHERISPATSLTTWLDTVPADSDRLGIVSGGWYAESLSPFLDTFADQVLVLLHDDVRDHPGETYSRALAHVGARPGFVPEGLAEVRFSNVTVGMDHADVVTDAERARLAEHYAPHVRRLEQLLGRDLSGWLRDH